MGASAGDVDRSGAYYNTAAWRAGFRNGYTLIDVGCGPGFAAMDLAAIAGTRGTVVAIDQSRRFLDALGERRANRD
jgi:ubiquinone/menaquinone biosynthesis C-methylase UbiE